MITLGSEIVGDTLAKNVVKVSLMDTTMVGVTKFA